MIEHLVKAPQELAETHNQVILKMNGLSVMKACVFTEKLRGSLFLEDHLLLFVQRGVYSISYGGEIYDVRPNEMILLKKAIVVQYQKTGDPDGDGMMEYRMFFLKDDLLREFSRLSGIKPKAPAASVAVSVKPVNERLLKYVDSLEPYFTEPDGIDEHLIKIKLLELLFDLAAADQDLMLQLLQLKQQARSDIPKIVEENLLNPVSVDDLAYLSGRSLSTFKREFQAIYSMPPRQWIRERRLDRAKELLMNSALSVTDICYMTGFENSTHFSRAFKEQYGISPAFYRQKYSFA
ncbi:AraC family transcriptional regulator [Paenibacillus gorillae]|uniref:AraC family transcriptional regulator n=1 Tax=Paenibacillus gorillae TaxID=1243662 RepID=UPI0004ADB77F|nr:AraC family transcriptional regulator [Paenibacillus gorillae]